MVPCRRATTSHQEKQTANLDRRLCPMPRRQAKTTSSSKTQARDTKLSMTLNALEGQT
ncbi:hypothetical protein M378DRAFT_162596 [Amanita muscaria Koide BX008]|uniref:Uncharacterized protein n=1 Tax=Amanita muscaria (strain Koide BX008) TaxID=946122 RepID=A0A0C2WTJ8_AMAMK|nr:hypothetical protein M378DRAFT_162596 [Amanita muscaria Koide BX008]